MPDQQAAMLSLEKATPYARAMGLRRGDCLVGLRGKPVEGDARTALARLRAAPQTPVHLTFQRTDEQWDLICQPRHLGRWSAVTHTNLSVPLRADTRLRNWEIWADADGVYDVQAQAPSLAGLLGPVYLLHMRLWGPLAVWAGVMTLGLGLGLVWAILFQALLSIYIWRAGPVMVKTDRLARGFRPWRVIACRHEKEVHDKIRQLAPDLRFCHTPQAPAIASAPESKT